MSEERISPIEIYRLLPGKNCGECGVPTCMAFSLKLIEGLSEAKACPYLSENNRKMLYELTAPPIRKVQFGGKNPVIMGGERSLHRHIQRFYNPTLIGVCVEVNESRENVLSKLKRAIDFKIDVTGQHFPLDFIYLSCAESSSESVKRANESIEYVKEHSNLPLMLSFKTDLIKEISDLIKKMKPVICGAEEETIEDFLKISQDNDCPIGLRAKSLDELESLSQKAASAGCEAVLNPVPDGTLNNSISILIQIRLAAIEHGIREFKHPILALPYLYNESMRDENEPLWRESLAGSACIIRYADAIVLNSVDYSTISPIYTVRQGYFSNPRKPATVKPGLYTLGDTGPKSYVMLTTNYALTYYLVSGDLQAANLDCYLLVVDSQGMSVDNAVAGKLIDGDAIANLMRDTEIESKVLSKTIIIPRGLSSLRGDIEEASGWRVFVGPEDSAELPAFLKKLDDDTGV